MVATAYLSHPRFLSHHGRAGHPECPERLGAIEARLREEQVFDLLHHHKAPMASRAQLLRVHTARLLDELEALSPAEGIAHVDPDTFMNSASLEAAWLAAGAAVKATELVVNQSVSNAFAALRPPGHHAERDRAMGFCLFNNIAVAAAAALEEHGLERVAVVDFDVHHGNGTENIFAEDERVLVCSTFQHPFYPYDGADTQSDNIVNVPLPAGTGSAAFREAVSLQWLPALNKFEPDMIFISAGFDAHAEDQLANFQLVDDDFGWVTSKLMGVANEHANGRIVSCLEGGYALDALARSAALHIRTLAGMDP